MFDSDEEPQYYCTPVILLKEEPEPIFVEDEDEPGGCIDIPTPARPNATMWISPLNRVKNKTGWKK